MEVVQGGTEGTALTGRDCLFFSFCQEWKILNDAADVVVSTIIWWQMRIFQDICGHSQSCEKIIIENPWQPQTSVAFVQDWRCNSVWSQQ